MFEERWPVVAGVRSCVVSPFASAHDVAAVLRRRLPAVRRVKLHKLLYYCQGHHLAAFSEPLFREAVVAWDPGPVVGRLWRDEKHGVAPPPPVELSEAALNTIGYVISRYGALTDADLGHLTRGEEPWRLADAARAPGGRSAIKPEWMRDYFRREGAPEGDDDEMPLDSETLARLLSEAAARPRRGRPDSRAELVAWGADAG